MEKNALVLVNLNGRTNGKNRKNGDDEMNEDEDDERMEGRR